MRKVKLPLTLDPVRTAQKRLDYQGVYTSAQVERVAESVVIVDSDVDCAMSFAVDSQPVHDSEHCEVSEADMVFGKLPAEAEKPNPFAVLASLKRK
ncbi:hypothetical protein FD733_09165 [Pantoea sp. Eser]|nr:hypothetical protein [Pantoea sp. Eser]